MFKKILKVPKFFHFPKVNLSRLKKIKVHPRKIRNFLLAHRVLVLVLIFLSLVMGGLIGTRNNFISQMEKSRKPHFSAPLVSYSPVTENIETVFYTVVSPAPSVLGVSVEESTYVRTPVYYPKPLPTPTFTPTPKPIPTSAPIVVNFSATPPPSTQSNSSAKNCSNLGTSPGVATAWYSQASLPQSVDNTATISIELRDCNNNIASVNDTLTITQTSGPGTTVNGSSPPISVEASGGRASFTVKSSTSGTAEYKVRNTTKSFNVTDPNNKHPKVTFNISTPASTATPVPSPTASSSPTPSPSSNPTEIPSPTSSIIPTSSPDSVL